MGIKFGEIDATQILENEFRITVLERVIDAILKVTPGVQVDIDQIRRDVVAKLREKYPNSGIEYRG